MYPNHATDLPDSTINHDLLAGTYSHPGFGVYTFTVEDSSVGVSSEKPAKRQPVATRDDLIVQTRLVLRHVFGDYWVAYLFPLLGSAFWQEFRGAKFITGADGKASALEITWEGATDRLSSVVAHFDRVGRVGKYNGIGCECTPLSWGVMQQSKKKK